MNTEEQFSNSPGDQLIHDIKPVAEVIEELIIDFEQAKKQMMLL